MDTLGTLHPLMLGPKRLSALIDGQENSGRRAGCKCTLIASAFRPASLPLTHLSQSQGEGGERDPPEDEGRREGDPVFIPHYSFSGRGLGGKELEKQRQHLLQRGEGRLGRTSRDGVPGSVLGRCHSPYVISPDEGTRLEQGQPCGSCLGPKSNVRTQPPSRRFSNTLTYLYFHNEKADPLFSWTCFWSIKYVIQVIEIHISLPASCSQDT